MEQGKTRYIKISPEVKILRFDFAGFLIGVYDSLIDASKEAGINAAGISRGVTKEGESAGGCFWIRVEKKDFNINDYKRREE